MFVGALNPGEGLIFQYLRKWLRWGIEQLNRPPLTGGGGLAGVIGHFSDMSFRHATTQT